MSVLTFQYLARYLFQVYVIYLSQNLVSEFVCLFVCLIDNGLFLKIRHSFLHVTIRGMEVSGYRALFTAQVHWLCYFLCFQHLSVEDKGVDNCPLNTHMHTHTHRITNTHFTISMQLAHNIERLKGTRLQLGNTYKLGFAVEEFLLSGFARQKIRMPAIVTLCRYSIKER